MKGVRVYQSRYSGEEIDQAIERALMFDPSENGWVHATSTVDAPIFLGNIWTPGNFIIDYFTDGPDALKDITPINVSVFYNSRNVIVQTIMLLNNIYYRYFESGKFAYGPWKVRKTTNCFYINEEPTDPDTDTIKIVPDENGEYVMSWWDGETWREVTMPDVMRKSIYDPQNRSTDFFKYTDELFQQMTSTQVGMVLDDTDITNKWLGEVSCARMTSLGDMVVTFKNSSKMIILDNNYNIEEVDMPVSFINPQVMGHVEKGIDSNQEIYYCTNYFVYDANLPYEGIFRPDAYNGLTEFVGGGPSIYKYSTLTKTWQEYLSGNQISINISNNLESSGTFVDIYAWTLLGAQVGSIEEEGSCAVTLMYKNSAGTQVYRKLVMHSRNYDPNIMIKALPASDVPVYVTNKDKYYRSGKYWKDDFYRGNDKMTPVKTNVVGEPEVGIMSACHYPYSMGIEGTEVVSAVAQIQWEWRDQNTVYTQIPKFVFSAKELTSDTDIVPEISAYLAEIDYYVQLSNFREFFGDFIGFGITTTGKLDKIEIVYDWETNSYQLDINTVNNLEDPTMLWEGIIYHMSSLCFFGRSVTVPESAHMFISTEEQNLLDAVSNHIMNGDIHFTEQDRIVLGSKENKDSAEIKFNRITIDNREYIDSRINESIETCKQLILDYDETLTQGFENHINDTRLHTTVEEKEYWNSKADGNHKHNLDGRVKINAKQIVEGVLDIARIPRGAKERITKVASIEERNKLTINEVQDGDRVAVKYDEANRENAYVVQTVVKQDLLCHVDETTGETILAVDEAFHEDAAGTGVYIDWVNVENTPTTIAGYGIIDSYTKTETEEEIDKRIKDMSVILENRFLEYDLDELYRIIRDTNDETHIIEEEMADAIGISEQVQIMDDLLILQEERINQMAEDLSEVDALVEDLLTKFA